MLWCRVNNILFSGQKKFKTPMNLFKVVSGKWKMLTLFEPKDGVETFVSPGYN